MTKSMKLEVMDGGTTDNKQDDKLKQFALIEDIARKTIAARNQSKEFQMEQYAELEKMSQTAIEGLSQEEVKQFHKDFQAALKAEDDLVESAENQKYIDQLKPELVEVKTYKLANKLEFTIVENESELIAKTRKEYVFWFKSEQRKSARATLNMCRTVYEASKALRETDFVSFCKDIGYDDNSSTIRKFLVIGKVYPRLIDFADKLPIAWTNIYLLTQIPADDFERCIKEGFSFDKLSGADLKELVDKTKDINKLTSPFKMDKKQMAYPVAKVFFTKLPDDTDFRLLQKAFDEIQARLPVKLQLVGEQVKIFKKRREDRYENLKQESSKSAVSPKDWDYGLAANGVYEKQKVA